MIMSLFVFQSFGQTVQPETVTINKSDLTATQLAKIAADEQMAKIETYGKWVGIGNEIGIAIKDGLNAVVDVSEKFGNTKVGTFTMYLIAWKVAGKDFVRIFLGLIFAVVITFLIFRSLRKMYPYKIPKRNRGIKFWETIEYEIIHPEDFEGTEVMKLILICMLIGSYGITYAIMFG